VIEYKITELPSGAIFKEAISTELEELEPQVTPTEIKSIEQQMEALVQQNLVLMDAIATIYEELLTKEVV
jgi:hypothetical protein